jgi:hypothetical protein
MTQYQEILAELRKGKVNYENELTGIYYIVRGNSGMKFNNDGLEKVFSNLESMARNINKFIKTGY